ncbi:MAG: c-type cytochrome [Gammaproteobacteria bacterium]|nr:c-type cytochrome [Gammaproteobacteria bacterium]
MTTFVGVLAVLVVIAFAFYFIAHSVTGGGEEASGPDPRMEAKILENIAPIENIRVGGSSASQDAAPRAARSGSDVYAAACIACHATGAAGAPKTGDKAAWAPRAAQGMDTLMQHTLNGFNAMPPKGTCADCSEEELRNAVQHLLKEAGVEAKGGQASAPAAAPVAAPAAAAAEPAAASGKGKEIYQASCFACHGTGAAGAPKIGDQAAWAPRIDKGMDTLLQHSINGFNAMPPKGTCMACSDEDLKAAVEYMISESK